MKDILIIGTSHKGYQIRPRCDLQDCADAFKRYLLTTVQKCAVQTVAEEMSLEALGIRHTVGKEIATERKLRHIYCDPNCSERQSLGISKDDTPTDYRKREEEWLRRVVQSCTYPVLFVCGACHVDSFANLCRDKGLTPAVVNRDFEDSTIPLDRRIF
jgi:hypothetical protein